MESINTYMNWSANSVAQGTKEYQEINHQSSSKVVVLRIVEESGTSQIDVWQYVNNAIQNFIKLIKLNYSATKYVTVNI
jgi:hypothetical protein